MACVISYQTQTHEHISITMNLCIKRNNILSVCRKAEDADLAFWFLVLVILVFLISVSLFCFYSWIVFNLIASIQIQCIAKTHESPLISIHVHLVHSLLPPYIKRISLQHLKSNSTQKNLIFHTNLKHIYSTMSGWKIKRILKKICLSLRTV